MLKTTEAKSSDILKQQIEYLRAQLSREDDEPEQASDSEDDQVEVEQVVTEYLEEEDEVSPLFSKERLLKAFNEEFGLYENGIPAVIKMQNPPMVEDKRAIAPKTHKLQNNRIPRLAKAPQNPPKNEVASAYDKFFTRASGDEQHKKQPESVSGIKMNKPAIETPLQTAKTKQIGLPK